MATTKPRSSKVVKKPVKKSAVKQKPVAEYKTLQVATARHPFMTYRPTLQSLYWLIFAVTVLGLGLWVVKLQVKIDQIYDKIDQNESIYSQLDTAEAKIRANKKAIVEIEKARAAQKLQTQP